LIEQRESYAGRVMTQLELHDRLITAGDELRRMTRNGQHERESSCPWEQVSARSFSLVENSSSIRAPAASFTMAQMSAARTINPHKPLT
jgi:hypothetical protein